MLTTAIPIEFGPHEADWWMLAATLLSVAASALLGYLAYKNGKRASQIAEQSANTAERALEIQKALHDEQINADYNARLDSAIAELFRKIREYYGPLEKWISEAEEVEIKGRVNPYTGDLLYPPDPPFDGVIAELEVTHLFTGPNDGRVIIAAEQSLRMIKNTYPTFRWDSMLKLIKIIRMWRTQEITRDDAIRSLDGLTQRSKDQQIED